MCRQWQSPFSKVPQAQSATALLNAGFTVITKSMSKIDQSSFRLANSNSWVRGRNLIVPHCCLYSEVEKPVGVESKCAMTFPDALFTYFKTSSKGEQKYFTAISSMVIYYIFDIWVVEISTKTWQDLTPHTKQTKRSVSLATGLALKIRKMRVSCELQECNSTLTSPLHPVLNPATPPLSASDV